VEVHDLHLWEVTTGFPALAAHVVVAPDEDCHARRRELQSLLGEDFGIRHVTLQVDHATDREKLLQIDSGSLPRR
jgi:cobalt-zinc-cadmium efflux system protein